MVFRLYGELFLMNNFLLISLGNWREINKKVYPNTSKCIFYASLFVLSIREMKEKRILINSTTSFRPKKRQQIHMSAVVLYPLMPLPGYHMF